MPAMTRVANAPVNFGIYRATSAPIGPRELLTELAEAGYDGVDSGPIRYLGADDLRQAGMGLAGGWVDLRYGDADGFAAGLPEESRKVRTPRGPGPRSSRGDLAAVRRQGAGSGGHVPRGRPRAGVPPTSRHGRGNAIGGSAPAGAHRHRRLPGHRPPVARRGRPRGRAAGLVGPDPADPCQGR